MKSKETVFDGKLIKVYRGMKVLPDGRKAYMEEVSHPGAALTVPIADNKVVFIRQYRAVVDEYLWELPAGILADGESPAECAERELEEETGYTSTSTSKLGYIYTSPGFCDEKIHVFKIRCGKKKKTKRDEHEIMTIRKFSVGEVKSMVKKARITDSKTLAALAFAGVI
jgi:ADP-ribose pyrophosphatase